MLNHSTEGDKKIMATKNVAEKAAPVAKMTKTQIVKGLSHSSMHCWRWQPSRRARQANSRFRGLASWSRRKRKERMGRNPSTGEQIKIAAKTTVKFRVAKAATEAIAPPRV